MKTIQILSVKDEIGVKIRRTKACICLQIIADGIHRLGSAKTVIPSAARSLHGFSGGCCHGNA